MTIIKIPIILIFVKAFKSSMTPPQPRAAEDELVRSTKLEGNTFADIIPFLPIFPQIVGYVEIITILAASAPSYAISQMVLSLTVFKGSAEPLHLILNGPSIAAALMVLIGAAVRSRAYHDLGNFFRFNVSIQKGHQLIKTGVYSYVRHPAYTGGMMVIVGWFLWNGAQGSWVRESGFFQTLIGRIITLGEGFLLLLLFLISIRRVSKEDEILRQKFGEEWEEWAKEVPNKLVPWVY